MSSEEDDYMSDAILSQCGDKRPGLVTKSTARRLEKERQRTEKDKRNQMKPKKVLEAEKRDEGLQKSLDSSNKGFALLAKMGYKPGQGIGKDGRQGRTEPVPLEVKDGRRGLGHATDRKRQREVAIRLRNDTLQKRQKLYSQHQEDFRARQRNARVDKEIERDLDKSQGVCYQLDTREGLDSPVQSFYWRLSALDTHASASASGCAESSDVTSGDDLGDAILREKGLLAPAVEGDTKDEEEEEEDEEPLEDENFTNGEKLEMVTAYLRSTYFYCVWCGTQYDDAADLGQHCPGDTRGDHDD